MTSAPGRRRSSAPSGRPASEGAAAKVDADEQVRDSPFGVRPGDEEAANRIDEYIELEDLHAGARGYATIAQALIGAGVRR